MAKSAYPTAADLAGYLYSAGLTTGTTVTTGGALSTLTVGSSTGMRVGDTLSFRTAGTTRTVTAVPSSTTVTVDTAVTVVTGEVVLILSAALDLATGIAAGIAAFEREAGRKMLALSDTTRTFDPPVHRGMLDLEADLAQVTTVTVDGVSKTVGTDLRFLPQDAQAEGKPWNRAEFKGVWLHPLGWGSYGDVSITGRWGYGTSLPEDVWTAMLQAGASFRFAQLQHALTGGLVQWSEADVSERYGEKPLSYLGESWKMGWLGVAAQYRRVTVGF